MVSASTRACCIRLLLLSCLLLVTGVGTASALEAAALSFADTRYEHRWSKAGQHEYTPQGQEDLQAWRDMLSLLVHPQVIDGEGLAGVANTVLGNYQRAGVIIHTDSRPATAEQPAEHLAVAALRGDNVVEVVFARFLLHDGVGLVVVRSWRSYGEDAAEHIDAWLQGNGEAIERALMAWVPPPLAAIQTLPESP